MLTSSPLVTVNSIEPGLAVWSHLTDSFPKYFVEKNMTFYNNTHQISNLLEEQLSELKQWHNYY